MIGLQVVSFGDKPVSPCHLPYVCVGLMDINEKRCSVWNYVKSEERGWEIVLTPRQQQKKLGDAEVKLTLGFKPFLILFGSAADFKSLEMFVFGSFSALVEDGKKQRVSKLHIVLFL